MQTPIDMASRLIKVCNSQAFDMDLMQSVKK